MGYKYNFEVATEDKEMDHILISDSDGQEKHPEHLQQHNHLQILHRHALTGNVKKCNEMIAELPEHQVTDTIAMLKSSLLEHDKHKAAKIIKELNW